MATHHETTEYKHGEMDTTQHEKTFAGFVRVSSWVVIISLAVLVFMALVNA
ncbi:aa3-type cytochrome c oxidase subunit IV [Paracoccus tegillarcae]|uniref:Aa3-type cytochrome c oxidase subunit IV n=1 Tax=Paracoccus tegillarcae TaxID=1529068 RepID=A0A2K9EJL3_9RHOB|nr:aa3-type cytochrome c oxidase subunit IV [Paracoccus tegillarcae]AUH35218.1 aa3-type cytochrome c oxidase subunit IV [Paracoccus tegillarcae]